MQWPLGELALENRLKDVQIALLGSGGRRRTLLTPAEAAVQRFGTELLGLLLSVRCAVRNDNVYFSVGLRVGWSPGSCAALL